MFKLFRKTFVELDEDSFKCFLRVNDSPSNMYSENIGLETVFATDLTFFEIIANCEIQFTEHSMALRKKE